MKIKKKHKKKKTRKLNKTLIETVWSCIVYCCRLICIRLLRIVFGQYFISNKQWLIMKFESFYFSEIIICEGQTSSIDCSSGMVINIVEAMYGRRALAYSNCNANYAISQSCVNNVDVSNTGCQLQRYCTLTPTNHGPYGSDPCPNKAKYLNMTYNCIPGKWFRNLKDSLISLSSHLAYCSTVLIDWSLFF